MRKASELSNVNIFSEAHKRDPFPFYALLRESAPVVQMKAPLYGKFWLVTRYEDVVSCLKDATGFVKDPRNAGGKRRNTVPKWLPKSIQALENNMLDVDDPNHKRLRKLVTQAFSRRSVELMRERIEKITRDVLADMKGQKQVDLLKCYALPIPLMVICELLGIAEREQPKFHKWSKAFLSSTSQFRMLLAIPQILSFVSFLKKMIRERQNNLGDDLVSSLILARDGEDRLSEDELVAMMVLLLIAGHETTVNLIASGTLALLEQPEEKQKFIDQPELATSAVEELLRFTSPVETATERYAAEDVVVGGVQITKGDLVICSLASANRDESVFKNADRLDMARTSNSHVSFGDGVHYCLGHQLARLEAEIAMPNLFQAFPNMRLAKPAEQLRWRETPVVRGLAELPVVLR